MKIPPDPESKPLGSLPVEASPEPSLSILCLVSSSSSPLPDALSSKSSSVPKALPSASLRGISEK